MRRCSVHDQLHEENEPCPSLGQKTHDCLDGDCEKYRPAVVKAHEKKRVLADGGKWNDKQQKAVTEVPAG
jgi:hypothetical protein